MLRRSVFSSFPLLPLTAMYMAGTIAGLYWWNIYIAIAIIIIAVILIVLRHSYFATLSLSFFVASLSASFYSKPDYQIIICDEYTWQGRIKQLKISDTSQLMTIEIYAIAGNNSTHLQAIRPFEASVTLADFTPELQPFDIITFTAKLDIPTPRYDLPDERDYAKFLQDRQIYYSTIIDRNNIIDVTTGSSIAAYGFRIRQHITDIIYRSQLSPSTKEFLGALITGDTSELSPDTRQSFRDAGLAHVLALSGLHVGIITIIFSLTLWPLYAAGHRRLRSIIIMLILWSYCIITGFSPSVTRAVVMATILITGTLLQRRVSALNSLCAAALVILIFDPKAISSISFIMSFAAVISILIFANDFNPVNQCNRFAYNLTGLITVSVAAMLGTGLISILYFHTFPIYFLISNILVTFLLPPLLMSGIGVIICSLIGLSAGLLCTLTDFLSQCVTSVSQFISSLPGATIDSIYLPAWILLPFIAMLITLKLWLLKKDKIYGIATCTLTASLIIIFCSITHTGHEPRIYLTRTSYHTDIVIDHGNENLNILTTSWQDTLQVRNRAEFRYADFMGRRGINTLHITPVNPMHSDTTLQYDNLSLTVLYRNPSSGNPTVAPTYLLICRGVTKPIDKLIKIYRPDTVLLSYDLSPRRIDSYTRQLHDLNIPQISLRDTIFSINLP